MPLVLVPTPLGNLGDVTLRALEVLRAADLIVAEDTRVARHLLRALDLPSKELWSYREQNADAVTAGILERARGQLVALVTDAGTPGISDPGSDLVGAAREAGVAVEVLPGPSAVIGAAALSGFPLRRFIFEGFPPRASGARREAFRSALKAACTTIWYESPQRIAAALADLDAVAPGARVFLVREYTKKFEQQLLGTPAEVAAGLEQPVRGEIAFAVAPYEFGEAPEADLDGEIDLLLARGDGVKAIARELSLRGAGDRNDIYKRALARRDAHGKRVSHGESESFE
jgi:16S rRNA (cytidine1402-2'-O)-methyltransferase